MGGEQAMMDIQSGITAEQFFSKNRVALMLRVFATKEDDVQRRVELVGKTVERAQSIVVAGKPVFSRIDVLIYADKRYPDHDCGKTLPAMVESFKQNKLVSIEEGPGDIFCGLGNYGFALEARHRCDYSVTFSPDAYSYMTPETVEAMIAAACKGARGIGVVLNELRQSVLEGRLCGTFAMWHIASMLTVGGLDLRAARPTDDRVAHYMRGWSPEKNDHVFYHLAGVEEMFPCARMVDAFGPCLAPIMPIGDGVPAYEPPDPVKQPDLYARHIKKMGTKFERQVAHLASIGHDISWLKGGVMPEYRRF